MSVSSDADRTDRDSASVKRRRIDLQSDAFPGMRNNGRCLVAAAHQAAEAVESPRRKTAADTTLGSWLPSVHSLLRWPLFLVACLVIFAVLILYFAIRALIHASEWLFAPSATRRARRSMMSAENYEAYSAAAFALDEANNLNDWKARRQSRFYAWPIVSAALVELVEAQEAGDWQRLLRALQSCLREVNFAGHLTEALYAKSFTGTKHLIEDYHEAVVGGLDTLRDLLEREGETLDETRRFAEFAVCTFGRSALCLSGGGAMAFQHFGVMDELLRRGVLPKIISGTSGGAAVATYVCVRTDAELLGRDRRPDLDGRYPLTLEPEEIQPSITLWAGTWCDNLQHYFRQGCLFEREPIERWAELWALGNTTFLEAYLRTGRVLNITCSMLKGESGAQTPLLLNYHSHPHVLISSAVICSGSMPSLLNPSKLMEKCPDTGLIRPHCKATCYADGSIDFDIPSQSLAQAFGVRYTIAVQVNPHVIPFNFPPHGDAGRPISWSSPSGRGRWRGGFVLCALELVLKESFRSSWKLMGMLELLPHLFGAKWDLFFAQVYEGSMTLSTDGAYLWKCVHALTNPGKDEFRYWWREGQVIAWQKMPLIEKRLRTEAALFRLDQALEEIGASSDHSTSPCLHPQSKPKALTPTGLSVRRRRSFLHETSTASSGN